MDPAIQRFCALPWAVERFFNRFAISTRCPLTDEDFTPGIGERWGVLMARTDPEPLPLDIEFFSVLLGLTFVSGRPFARLAPTGDESGAARSLEHASDRQREAMAQAADGLLHLHLQHALQEADPLAWAHASQVLHWLVSHGGPTLMAGRSPSLQAHRNQCIQAASTTPEGRAFLATPGVAQAPWLASAYPTWKAWICQQTLDDCLPATPAIDRRPRL